MPGQDFPHVSHRVHDLNCFSHRSQRSRPLTNLSMWVAASTSQLHSSSTPRHLFFATMLNKSSIRSFASILNGVASKAPTTQFLTNIFNGIVLRPLRFIMVDVQLPSLFFQLVTLNQQQLPGPRLPVTHCDSCLGSFLVSLQRPKRLLRILVFASRYFTIDTNTNYYKT